MTSRSWRCVLAFVTCAAINGHAQDLTTRGGAQSTVRVPVFVTDGAGKPAREFDVSRLQVFEDKAPLHGPVEIQSGNTLPLLLGIVIDTSESERYGARYRQIVEALPDLVASLLTREDDRVFLITFSKVARSTPSMTLKEFLDFKLHIKPSGASAVYDGVLLACKQHMEFSQGEAMRKVLIVVSDGEDNQSEHSQAEAIAAAQRTGTVIFTLDTTYPEAITPQWGMEGASNLRRFSLDTGGENIWNINGQNLMKNLDAIREEVANMYIVSYNSTAPGKKQGYALNLASTDKLFLIRAPKRRF